MYSRVSFRLTCCLKMLYFDDLNFVIKKKKKAKLKKNKKQTLCGVCFYRGRSWGHLWGRWYFCVDDTLEKQQDVSRKLENLTKDTRCFLTQDSKSLRTFQLLQCDQVRNKKFNMPKEEGIRIEHPQSLWLLTEGKYIGLDWFS